VAYQVKEKDKLFLFSRDLQGNGVEGRGEGDLRRMRRWGSGRGRKSLQVTRGRGGKRGARNVARKTFEPEEGKKIGKNGVS